MRGADRRQPSLGKARQHQWAEYHTQLGIGSWQAGWKMLGENVKGLQLVWLSSLHPMPSLWTEASLSSVLGVKSLPLDRNSKKGEQIHYSSVLPFQLSTQPLRRQRSAFRGTICYSSCLMDRLKLEVGQCLMIQKNENVSRAQPSAQWPQIQQESRTNVHRQTF